MLSSRATRNTPRPRQQAGVACEECRRRKLRCDRGQPQCGVCRESGAVCTRTTARQPRGPKKGHLRAMQSRIVALERRLNNEEGPEDELLAFPEEGDTHTTPNDQPFEDFWGQDTLDGTQHNTTTGGSSNSSLWAQENPCRLQDTTAVAERSSNSSTEELALSSQFMLGVTPLDSISEFMRADLDHLYFDRAHTFCPFLNKRHYFTRAGKSLPGNEMRAFACLQSAMWTLAASMSTQFQLQEDSIYVRTRMMLENLEMDPLHTDSIQIEQVQAWTLLSIYEFIRIGYRRAWMSAGKCFRLAVLMKLHNIDGLDGIAANNLSALGSAEIEERRRTFWMAYTIDRFSSLLDQLPLTFDQHVILTRLPAPEHEFQSDESVIMGFLSDFQQDDQSKALSTFTESIRLVTLCGQSLSHQQQGTAEYARGFFSLDFWTRHRQLDSRITRSIESMSLHDPGLLGLAYLDPMPLFTHMAAQAAVLIMYRACQSSPWGVNEYQDIACQYEHRALAAAQQMVALSKALIQLSYFKVHPFTPVLLYLCGDFLRSNIHLDQTFEMQAALQTALQSLAKVNRMAADCLDRLEMLASPSS